MWLIKSQVLFIDAGEYKYIILSGHVVLLFFCNHTFIRICLSFNSNVVSELMKTGGLIDCLEKGVLPTDDILTMRLHRMLHLIVEDELG